MPPLMWEYHDVDTSHTGVRDRRGDPALKGHSTRHPVAARHRAGAALQPHRRHGTVRSVV